MPGAKTAGATPFLPHRLTLPEMREAVQGCRGCDLYAHATQAVLGDGPSSAVAMFIGEQPGDQEDQQGKPFVGPAGRLLSSALEEAGIDRTEVYVTNTVKHFSFEERGKRRIHKKPKASEIKACRPWLDGEIAVIKPEVIVCLGATAAQAILGKEYRVTEGRGEFVSHALAPYVTSTIHPSAILRVIDADERKLEYQRFVTDLTKVRDMLRQVKRANA